MFGKPISQYVAFQKVLLGLLVAVGVARLALSLSGLPDSTVRWLSMNVVLWAATLYYGVAAHTQGFGSYKQLLPLVVIQVLVFQSIAAVGILLAIAGFPNIFAAPEYSFGASSQGIHLLAHLTIGIVVPSLLLWGVSSLVLLAAKRIVRRPLPA
jgi:hypothetical protein